MGQIYEISSFSLLDYPDELACIVWISGCNLRCAYCHNPDIVLNRGDMEDAELLAFLKKRSGRLTAVVFSGGEATFYPGLPELVRQAKELGFKTKIDTNGSNPEMLRHLVASGTLDMIALDYKCPPQIAEKLIGTTRFVAAFEESLDFLIAESRAERVRLEVRTTVATEFMNEEDVAWMIGDLDARGYQGTYYLQNIATSGEKTLGNLALPERVLDQSRLPVPKNFTLGFRNFPGQGAR